MKRQAQAVVLMLLGGAVLRTSLTDAYLRYVKEGLRPFLIAAGVALVAIAVATLYYELRERRAAHAHEHPEPKVSWLLLAPVVGLLLVAPGALGAYAADSTGTALGAWEEESDYPPLPDGDPAEIPVLDYASRAIFDEGRSIEGRRVRLTGFISRADDGTVFLTRMILSCCAADARPIKVGIEGAGTDGYADDTWVAVVGTYSPTMVRDPINNERIPFIAAETLEPVGAPVKEYE
ncbi:TIGR03943 family putative permease subunit [Phytomonospora endophytica]|uniref:Putative repeat protein (TIGR03943 family) n=1 Tax=Phytomonospora endophytica TaxID=714109 RepID=A0A841FCU8_9ACTN|nr:TIGR03943 family protein [Phytomonospora endophytica]MBB6034096.1 putative repeat protein (TIGR03943 family) [Phytomonospora endophytica]GIG66490.1 membrane protein [Phytomonospora endophytica]